MNQVDYKEVFNVPLQSSIVLSYNLLAWHKVTISILMLNPIKYP